MIRRRALAAAALLAWPALACAQAWPSRPVRVVVPFAAGGSADVIARAIVQKVGQATGQQFVVDNRPGASGTLGAGEVVRAAPDGQTMLFTTSSTHAVAPHLSAKLPYDTVTQFTPIAHLADAPLVLLVTPGLEAKSVAELIELARQRPGRLNYGSSGNGTIPQLAAEAFKAQAGVFITHIPYKGGAQAMPDLIAGNVHVLFDAIPSAMPHMREGRVRALAVTSPRRSSIEPQLPTLAESGLPGFAAVPWFGLYGPAGMAPELVQRIHGEFAMALRAPDIVARLARLGAEPGQGSPADFAALVARDSARWAALIRERKIAAD